MAHTRIHGNLQALNRTLEELKDYTHTYTFRGTVPHGWQNRIIKRKLETLSKYLDNLREIELANTIPEVGDAVHRVQDLLEKIEQEAEETVYSPTDPAVLTDDPPIKTYVYSARNNLDGINSALELNPKEIAKNVYGARHPSPEGLEEEFLDMLSEAQAQRMASQRARSRKRRRTTKKKRRKKTKRKHHKRRSRKTKHRRK